MWRARSHFHALLYTLVSLSASYDLLSVGGRHTPLSTQKKRAWHEDRPGSVWTATLVLSAPSVKGKQVWRSEEKIVSVWSERDYPVGTSSRADARISARACTSKPVNLCQSVCTPAIFQLAFIFARQGIPFPV